PLTIDPGEILGVVGESGSGKTTLGLALIGYVRRGLSISAGSIRFKGSELREMRPGQLRRLRGGSMSYVPQDPGTALNPLIRVGSLLDEVLAAHGHSKADARARVAQVLAEGGLPDADELLSCY